MILKQQLNGNVEEFERQMHLKQLELNSLLEVTQAINANLSEEALYKIYHFTLIANLQIKKLSLFVLDDKWECKVSFGIDNKPNGDFISQEILKIKTIAEISKADGLLKEFEIIIPVLHKNKVLAYVFLGEVQNENKELIDLSFIQTLSSILIVAIENKKFARKELYQEALRKELSIARDVQNRFIPKELPSNDRISIMASYLPHQEIGGDYYDYIKIDEERFLVCIADVSGKGIPAALMMSNFQASLRTLIRQTTDLVDIFTELNHLLVNNSKGDRFITFFAAICDLSKNEMVSINAGHNPPVLISKEGREVILDKGSTILGAFSSLPFIETQTESFSSGSFFLAFTDGITETYNEENEEFGFDRLKNLANKLKASEPSLLHEEILKELDIFRGKNSYADDVSLLTCCFI